MSGVSHPYFSIVIPTLNEVLFLPSLISCIKKQSEKDYELIVVDGNSGDKTREIARKAGARVYSVSKRNVSYQRNVGGEKARGTFIIFLDADVTFQKGFLRQVRQEITKHKSLFYTPSMHPASVNIQTRALFAIVNLWARITAGSSKPFVTSGSLIIERNFFNLIGGFDERIFIGEDHSIAQKAAAWGVRPYFLKDVYLTFSLRRAQVEGIPSFFSKYLYASAHIFFKGDIKKKLFTYEMGGHLYDQPDKGIKGSQTK